MPPIDPQQLLKALGPLLTNTGGIRGAQEASRIASLMKDASKLVTRCIYLNILRVTDSVEALKKFMEVGGWDTLNTWLEMARDDNNEPLLGELLEVYQTMPVTVGLLKQNSAAKTIKQLSKADKEKIKMLSSLLVETWTKIIRDQKQITDNNDEDKKKQKKSKDKERDEKLKDLEKNDKENEKKGSKDSDRSKNREKDSKEKDSKDKDSKDKDSKDKDRSHKDRKEKDKHKDREQDKSKRDKSKSSSSSSSSSSSLSLPSTKHQSSASSTSGKSKDSSSASKRHLSIDDSKSSTSSSTSVPSTTNSNKSQEGEGTKDEPRRPKTVKQYNTKFRSTGLFDEEEEEEVESVKKKLEKPAVKRPSMDNKIEESIEKKPRLQLTMPTLTPANVDATNTTPPEVTHGRIKLIPPKRPPAHEIQESHVFMDALQQATYSTGIKRKKKLVSPSTTSAPSFKGSPPSASSPPSATSPPQGAQANESGPTSPPLLSPTTAIAQKLPSVPSFYRDTLEDLPESTAETKKDSEQDDESPPSLEDMDTGEADVETNSKDKEQTMETNEEKSPDFKMADGAGETGMDLPLKLSNGKKPKKTVSWARDHHLEEIFYFEMDETERENVNRPKNFTDMKKAEMLLDRRAMESAKRFSNDTMVEVLPWKRPKPIDNVISLIEPGCNSVEKHIQMEREQVVLCALFFNKVPDTPNEPDPDISSDKAETKLIPLEDENGSCTEYEHTYNFNDPSSLPYDPEFGGLPLQNHGPPMNPAMNNLAGGNMNNMNMGNIRGHMNIPPQISHILNTLQQQAQETRDPVMQNLQGMLSNVLQNTNPQDSGMLMERILGALEPFRNQIPGLSNLINSVTGGSMEPHVVGPRFMMQNQMGNPRHGLLGSAPPGFNMIPGGNMRPNLSGPGSIMGNSGGIAGNSNFFMGGGGGKGGGREGGNILMGGPPNQWRGGSNRSRPFGRRGGARNVVCQFYMKKGMCKYGDNCQFIHPDLGS